MKISLNTSILILLVSSIQIMGCSIFQKTSKTNSEHLQRTHEKTEQIQTDQQQANKETQIYSFWSDSGLFQFQTIREQFDRKTIRSKQKAENSSDKVVTNSKESKPPDLILYTLVSFIIFGCLMLFRKL